MAFLVPIMGISTTMPTFGETLLNSWRAGQYGRTPCGRRQNGLPSVVGAGERSGTVAGGLLSMGMANALRPLSGVSQGAYYAVTAITLFLSTLVLSYLDKVTA